MATITVEGVPETLLARLAAAAAANGRCVHSELIVLLARSLPQAARPGLRPRPCRCAAGAPTGAPRVWEGWGGPAL